MKKIILTPKKDSMTICLPPDWVGKPLVCILKTPDETEDSLVSMVSEDAICYQAERHNWAGRGNRHRLRRRGLLYRRNLNEDQPL